MADTSILKVEQVARMLHRDPQTVRFLLDNQLVSWGLAYRRQGSKRKSYVIFREKFETDTGIKTSKSEGTSE